MKRTLSGDLLSTIVELGGESMFTLMNVLTALPCVSLQYSFVEYRTHAKPKAAGDVCLGVPKQSECAQGSQMLLACLYHLPDRVGNASSI